MKKKERYKGPLYYIKMLRIIAVVLVVILVLFILAAVVSCMLWSEKVVRIITGDSYFQQYLK